MRRFLLDTGIAGDYLSRRRGVFERARDEAARGNRIGIGLPVLGESIAGIEYSASREKNFKKLRQALPNWLLRPFTAAAAWEYGRLFAELKRSGKIVQQVDLQVAAIALTLGSCTVVSSDSDLTTVPGLTVENWAK